MASCPICGTGAVEAPANGRIVDVRCGLCGRVRLTHEALHVLPKDNADRALLSAHFRHQPEEYPPVTAARLGEILAEGWPPFGVSDQLAALLELLARGTPAMGRPSRFDLTVDFPLLWVKSAEEAAFLAGALLDQGLVSARGPSGRELSFPARSLPLLQRGNQVDAPRFTLTADGWREVQAERGKPPVTSQVFVAMRFSAETDGVYEKGIEPAILAAGYRACRVDREEHTNRIDDEIVAQIRRSRFMVADFAGQRQGVYFEAGLMWGLGRRVIWMCPQVEKDDLHFDVSHYNCILYDSAAEAKAKLRTRILATEGEGPIPADARGGPGTGNG